MRLIFQKSWEIMDYHFISTLYATLWCQNVYYCFHLHNFTGLNNGVEFQLAVLRPPEAWYPWHGPQTRAGSLHFGHLQRQRCGCWPDLVGQCTTKWYCSSWIVNWKELTVNQGSTYSSSCSLLLVIFHLMSLMVTLCTIHHIIKPVDRKHPYAPPHLLRHR